MLPSPMKPIRCLSIVPPRATALVSGLLSDLELERARLGEAFTHGLDQLAVLLLALPLEEAIEASPTRW